jgi:NADH:ubiquinone oxidoreductase subunit H
MQLGWKRLIPGALVWLVISTVVIGLRQFGLPWST